MAVYVDPPIFTWKGRLWGHMLADTVEELHEFAKKLGMRREWFQDRHGGSWPHYDVTEGMRQKAIRKGAVIVDTRQMVLMIRRWRREIEAGDRIESRALGQFGSRDDE